MEQSARTAIRGVRTTMDDRKAPGDIIGEAVGIWAAQTKPDETSV